MITLYTFGPALGLPDPSPFVTKAEVLLKMSGLAYRCDSGGFRHAPKGKLPYVDDDGTVVADSTFIRWHLERTHGIDFDRGLDERARAVAWAVEKMLEDNLYWAIVRDRWMVDANFERGPASFFAAIPWPLRPLVVKMIRRQVRRSLHGQGMGRHRPEEVAALATRCIDATARILGDGPYLMGSEPCGADATVFAFVSGALCPVFDTPSRAAAESHQNLVDYVARMNARYYPVSP
ncbi:MAG: glutathione S-transferase family protein [Ectothiorhodospiraceae bacterium]|nr:glutathione S-transferase family protein [Chromatiales bacterium]MCP5154791.1 glutathione S-transferase family protein [Ectothiorhodospiraceae bacterium]